MTVALIVYRSLRQYALSTAVTAAGIALAAGLFLCVWTVKTESQAAFMETATSFDAVLGARGSKLQLVLNAVFHLEASPGNIAWADYEAVRRHPLVKTAMPVAMGDNYRGYRLVGTLPELLASVEFHPGRKLALEPGGRFIAGPQVREAIVGSFAARQLGFKVGAHFHPAHGLEENDEHEHEEEYEVVGILAPTNTPIDRVIWIPVHGVQTMSGHDPKSAGEISAVLLQLRSPAAGVMLDQMYNRQGTRLTFAYPVGTVVAELFAKVAWFDRVLTLVAYLVALVACGSVLASIYNSMHARRRDLAILRALGAHRRTVLGAVVAEAATIGLIGSLLGLAVYAALFFAIAAVVRAETGIVLVLPWQAPVNAIAPGVLVALCAVGGLVPAVKAYRLPVADSLAPLS